MYTSVWQRLSEHVHILCGVRRGRLVRSRKFHEVATEAVGGTPNLHHTQVVFKEPHSVYEFAWHQDYGYHYGSMIMLPSMCTILVAIDHCHKGNGGLEVVEGSHACGRLDHVPRSSQTRQLTVDPKVGYHRCTMLQSWCRVCPFAIAWSSGFPYLASLGWLGWAANGSSPLRLSLQAPQPGPEAGRCSALPLQPRPSEPAQCERRDQVGGHLVHHTRTIP